MNNVIITVSLNGEDVQWYKFKVEDLVRIAETLEKLQDDILEDKL